MKFLFALTILALVSQSLALPNPEEQMNQPKDQLEYAWECMNESRADPNVFAQGRQFVDFLATPDRKIYKFVECFLQTNNIFDEDGNFNEGIAKKKLVKGDDKDKVDIAINECKNRKGLCSCDTAYEFYKCYNIVRNAL